MAAQVGGLSAFLGGFAAAFLGTLLALGSRGRTASLSIGFAVSSSVAFVVAVVASTGLAAVLHPQAPQAVAASFPLIGARILMVLGFIIGLYALLFSLALSGWSRSRGTGYTTSIAAGIGMALVSWVIVRVG